jgi:hypothetical protein
LTTRVSRGGWVLLAAGLTTLALVPARAAEKSSTVSAPVPSAAASDNAAKPAAPPVVPAPARPKPRVKSEAEEIQTLREMTRMTPKFSGSCGGYDRIGALTAFPFWTKTLPLANEQIRTINMLEAVVGESRELSFYNEADYPTQSLAEYQAYLNRSHPRRLAAIKHAQRIVALGLLTDQQAEFVLYRYVSKSRPTYSFGEARLSLFSVDPEVQKRNQAEMMANNQDTDAATLALLSPNQRLIWSRTNVVRELAKEPPELPAIADLEADREKLRQERSLFCILGRVPSYFGESGYQRRLLRDLEEVTATGLSWIRMSKSPAEQVAQRRAAFLRHAEQFALTGILTEDQAKQADKKREVDVTRVRVSGNRP